MFVFARCLHIYIFMITNPANNPPLYLYICHQVPYSLFRQMQGQSLAQVEASPLHDLCGDDPSSEVRAFGQERIQMVLKVCEINLCAICLHLHILLLYQTKRKGVLRMSSHQHTNTTAKKRLMNIN